MPEKTGTSEPFMSGLKTDNNRNGEYILRQPGEQEKKERKEKVKRQKGRKFLNDIRCT
jgi:hypothetical protein